jgi:hypothetical protein
MQHRICQRANCETERHLRGIGRLLVHIVLSTEVRQEIQVAS